MLEINSIGAPLLTPVTSEFPATPSDDSNNTETEASSPLPSFVEDDDDQEHMVQAMWVVEWPGKD